MSIIKTEVKHYNEYLKSTVISNEFTFHSTLLVDTLIGLLNDAYIAYTPPQESFLSSLISFINELKNRKQKDYNFNVENNNNNNNDDNLYFHSIRQNIGDINNANY